MLCNFFKKKNSGTGENLVKSQIDLFLASISNIKWLKNIQKK